MYVCRNCRRFFSLSPTKCWCCGKMMEDCWLRVLFVGAIDGEAEISFLECLSFPKSIVYITSYRDASSDLMNIPNKAKPEYMIKVQANVDATNLASSFLNERFDVIVWIGPTNDSNLKETPKLVGKFVSSSSGVLHPNGIVLVVQDAKTPNFRGIITLPSSLLGMSIKLNGRTQTQHSSKIVKMSAREDQVYVFARAPCSRECMDPSEFEAFLTSVMSSKETEKIEIARDIFKEYSLYTGGGEIIDESLHGHSTRQLSPYKGPNPLRKGLYSCPRCKKYASTGPGYCWKCGARLV